MFPSPGSLVRLAGAALADQSDARAGGRFMVADGMRNLGRDGEDGETAPGPETLEEATSLVVKAMREAA